MHLHLNSFTFEFSSFYHVEWQMNATPGHKFDFDDIWATLTDVLLWAQRADAGWEVSCLLAVLWLLH